MKIAIIGSGGVGGYFGGRLAQSGHNVTFFARGKHLEAIRERGLQVKSILGDFTVLPAKATAEMSKIGIVDLVILAVKAWQVKGIAKDLHKLINGDTLILPLQNGVLAAEELASEIDSENIIGGLCRIISKIEEPGIINHFGIEPSIVLGELDSKKSERILRLSEMLNLAGIKALITENFHVELWQKFIGICASGLLAVTRSTYGEIRETAETRSMLTALLTEVYQVGKKGGVELDEQIIHHIMVAIDGYPYNSTSSLTRDVWEGKPSEIEYQNGTVVRLGYKYGVPTPVNQFVYNCILPMEKRARKACNE